MLLQQVNNNEESLFLTQVFQCLTALDYLITEFKLLGFGELASLLQDASKETSDLIAVQFLNNKKNYHDKNDRVKEFIYDFYYADQKSQHEFVNFIAAFSADDKMNDFAKKFFCNQVD